MERIKYNAEVRLQKENYNNINQLVIVLINEKMERVGYERNILIIGFAHYHFMITCKEKVLF